MPFLGEWTRRLLALVHRGRLERDLDDELAFHMAMREAEHPIPMSTGPSSTLRFLESADQA